MRRRVPRAGRPLLGLVVGILGLGLGACSQLDDNTRDAIENVATLRQGTVSDLKALRFTGPFHEYDVDPATLFEAVETAARRLRGAGGHPIRAVFTSTTRMEIVAKERAPELAWDDGYSEDWRSAMVATVHAVPGAPHASRLEIHCTHRGPFHQGEIEWNRDLPPVIEQVLAGH